MGLLDSLLASETLRTAFALGVAGVLGWWVKDALPQLLRFVSRYFVSSVTVNSRDEMMLDTLLRYLDAHQSVAKLNQFNAHLVRGGKEWQSFSDDVQQGHQPRAAYSPSSGWHILRIDGRWIWMQRDLSVGMQVFESLRLSSLGRDKRFLESLIDQAVLERLERERDKVAIYFPNPFTHHDWTRARLSNQRHLSTVVLRAGQSELILQDLQKFFHSGARYEELGIAWRRGYLLYGPPGTGKTSLVTALACELRLNVCTLSLAASGITDDKIGGLLASVPPRSIILIEDVDAFFHERKRESEQVKLSFSGFLNALDGVTAHEGSVVFLTTNHPETLDPALVRSGRIDYRLELGYCDRHQLEHMFLKFFADGAAANLFAETLSAQPAAAWSAAQVQERLLKAANIEDAFALFDIPTPVT